MIQAHSLLIRFNDLILIALHIYLLVRRKTTSSLQGLSAGALKTGLLEKPVFLAPFQGLRAFMCECGLQTRRRAGGGGLKGQGPGKRGWQC